MHRIDGPAALPGGSFTEGDPAVGTPATVVTDDWLNAVQEEISTVVEGASISLSKSDNAQLLKAIAALISRAIPPGAISAFGAASAPAGWLECNGAEVSRSAYPALWVFLGTSWGAGNGSTTFNLPDFRGEFLRGWDHDRNVDGGRGFATAQSDQLKQTSFPFVLGSNAGAQPSGYNPAVLAQTDRVPNLYEYTVTLPGGNETRPRNRAVMFCIKV